MKNTFLVSVGMMRKLMTVCENSKKQWIPALACGLCFLSISRFPKQLDYELEISTA